MGTISDAFKISVFIKVKVFVYSTLAKYVCSFLLFRNETATPLSTQEMGSTQKYVPTFKPKKKLKFFISEVITADPLASQLGLNLVPEDAAVVVLPVYQSVASGDVLSMPVKNKEDVGSCPKDSFWDVEDMARMPTTTAISVRNQTETFESTSFVSKEVDADEYRSCHEHHSKLCEDQAEEGTMDNGTASTVLDVVDGGDSKRYESILKITETGKCSDEDKNILLKRVQTRTALELTGLNGQKEYDISQNEPEIGNYESSMISAVVDKDPTTITANEEPSLERYGDFSSLNVEKSTSIDVVATVEMTISQARMMWCAENDYKETVVNSSSPKYQNVGELNMELNPPNGSEFGEIFYDKSESVQLGISGSASSLSHDGMARPMPSVKSFNQKMKLLNEKKMSCKKLNVLNMSELKKNLETRQAVDELFASEMPKKPDCLFQSNTNQELCCSKKAAVQTDSAEVERSDLKINLICDDLVSKINGFAEASQKFESSDKTDIVHLDAEIGQEGSTVDGTNDESKKILVENMTIVEFNSGKMYYPPESDLQEMFDDFVDLTDSQLCTLDDDCFRYCLKFEVLILFFMVALQFICTLSDLIF